MDDFPEKLSTEQLLEYSIKENKRLHVVIGMREAEVSELKDKIKELEEEIRSTHKEMDVFQKQLDSIKESLSPEEKKFIKNKDIKKLVSYFLEIKKNSEKLAKRLRATKGNYKELLYKYLNLLKETGKAESIS